MTFEKAESVILKAFWQSAFSLFAYKLFGIKRVSDVFDEPQLRQNVETGLGPGCVRRFVRRKLTAGNVENIRLIAGHALELRALLPPGGSAVRVAKGGGCGFKALNRKHGSEFSQIMIEEPEA